MMKVEASPAARVGLSDTRETNTGRLRRLYVVEMPLVEKR
jgi:hypothetical protein